MKRFDPGALAAGLLFIGLALYFLVDGSRRSLSEFSSIVAVLLVGLGLAGLARNRKP